MFISRITFYYGLVKLLSELTEHTIAGEIEMPKEILRKEFQ